MLPLAAGLRRGWQRCAAATAPAAVCRSFTSSSGKEEEEGGAPTKSSSKSSRLADQQQKGVDVLAEGAPRRYFQLIGDPRTGVADDTTHDIFGDIQVEHVWHQESNEVNWFRYSRTAEATPHMYMDARLSDHSKNLMYLLRAKDPQRCVRESV